MDYLGNPSLQNPTLALFIENIFNGITLGDIVISLKTGTATERMVSLAERLMFLVDRLESAIKLLFRLLFEPMKPTDENVDLVETNFRFFICFLRT